VDEREIISSVCLSGSERESRGRCKTLGIAPPPYRLIHLPSHPLLMRPSLSKLTNPPATPPTVIAFLITSTLPCAANAAFRLGSETGTTPHAFNRRTPFCHMTFSIPSSPPPSPAGGPLCLPAASLPLGLSGVHPCIPPDLPRPTAASNQPGTRHTAWKWHAPSGRPHLAAHPALLLRNETGAADPHGPIVLLEGDRPDRADGGRVVRGAARQKPGHDEQEQRAPPHPHDDPNTSPSPNPPVSPFPMMKSDLT
jgi:hypothetical protein